MRVFDRDSDELPCVIGDKSEGDCIWQGSRSSTGSWFHRHGAACRIQRFV